MRKDYRNKLAPFKWRSRWNWTSWTEMTHTRVSVQRHFWLTTPSIAEKRGVGFVGPISRPRGSRSWKDFLVLFFPFGGLRSTETPTGTKTFLTWSGEKGNQCKRAWNFFHVSCINAFFAGKKHSLKKTRVSHYPGEMISIEADHCTVAQPHLLFSSTIITFRLFWFSLKFKRNRRARVRPECSLWFLLHPKTWFLHEN